MLEPRRATLLAGPFLAGGAIVALSFAEGGFFPRSWTPATVALAAGAALAALLMPGGPPARAELVLVGAVGALAAWQALSAVWSLEPGDSLADARRGLLYVAAAAAFAVVARRTGAAWLLAGVAAGATVVAAYAVGRRVVAGAEEVPFQGLVLNQPLGYANALGILAALGLLALAGLAQTSVGSAALAAAPAALLAATLALTSSRGAWLAAGVGAGTLLAFRIGPPAVRGFWLAAVALGLAAALVSPLVWSPATLERALSDRPYYWWTAWQAVPDHAPLGSGAGTFDALWAAGAPIPGDVLDAHTLPLEALVELGPVGLALVLLLAVPLVAALRAPGGPVVATAAGAYTAFLVHASLDWDWEMPAVAVAGLACGAAVLAARAPQVSPASRVYPG